MQEIANNMVGDGREKMAVWRVGGQYKCIDVEDYINLLLPMTREQAFQKHEDGVAQT